MSHKSHNNIGLSNDVMPFIVRVLLKVNSLAGGKKYMIEKPINRMIL